MSRGEIAVIGSGIVGMAVARGLLEFDPALRITIYEKENEFSSHASARNSGVLHAGFYYSPDSLKARFCRDGRNELESIAMKYGVPTRRIGKVVVAQSADDELRLETLLNLGTANGVDLKILPEKDLKRFEPLAKTYGSFLWSPNTAISDPVSLNEVLRQELISRKVRFVSKAKVQIKNQKWMIGSEEIQAGYFVNAAGAWSLDFAHAMDLGTKYSTMPFLGIYKMVRANKLPIRRLIYPVPHPVNPFLGVHFTLTTSGYVKIGPSALPIIGKNQYSFSSSISLQDLVSFGRNLVSLAKGDKHDLYSILKYEVPKLFTANLVKSAAELVPSALQIEGWSRKEPGIRGQLINISSGELVQDFVIEHGVDSTHVLNSVSPGWTASLPFGRYIAQKVLERLTPAS